MTGDSARPAAAALEFALEGLYLISRLSKDATRPPRHTDASVGA